MELELIVGMAQQAFWAVVAEHYPEIKTGDLDPGVSVEFDRACEETVKLWLQANGQEVED